MIKRAWNLFFGDTVRAFGSMSVILVISLAVAPAKGVFREWRSYQRGYEKLIAKRGDAVTLQRRFEPGIHQIWKPEMGVVDRCTTCHVAMSEQGLKDVSLQPYRPHPPVPHALDEFGCVACHHGQGRATTSDEAHRTQLAWEQPILPAKYDQSACGECHLTPLEGTPRLNQGRTLLAREGCVHCHTVQLGDGTRLAATDDPPELLHIADKTSREWIYAWLKDPQAYSTTATMPNFGLTDEQARDISAYLIAQSQPLAGDTLTLAAVKSSDPAAGTSLYGESFCASCHAMQNAAGNMVGGDVGPELTNIGSKAKPEWLAAWLRDPAHYDAGTAMPRYRFTDAQIATLSGFLAGKTNSDLLANVHLDAATPEQIEHGKRLVNEFGCAACHALNGIRKPENFAPDLTRVGSRSLAQVIFTPGMQRDLPTYVAAKVRNPRAFGANLKMPKFNLTDAQVDALTTALLAQTDRQQEEAPQYRQASQHPSNYQPAGKAAKLIADLRCFSCHSINGRGGDMAPDLSWEGSSVQREWLVAFFKNPNTLRPALIRRMPRFNLADAEVQTLTDYIMTVYQAPAFDADSMPATFTPAQVETGRQLFYSKYACQSCHIADPAKDKGYIGPMLASVGTRLTPAWMFHYLKDPQALRPGNIEPNQHISDEDARALTAFLSSLKGKPVREAKK
ncbi:MAG TPA: c-type cytochrome [Terriglobales bacterium]|nr:c-type cytochrome [Terriglobales bacterium]